MKSIAKLNALACAACLAGVFAFTGCERTADQVEPEPAEIETDFADKQAFIQINQGKLEQVQKRLAALDRSAIEEQELKQSLQELERSIESARTAVQQAAAATQATWDSAREQAYREVTKVENDYAQLQSDLPDGALAETRQQ